MSVWRDLYRGDTRFDFFGNRRRWFTISGVIVAVSLFALVFLRLDLGVDFEGGTLVEFENPNAVSVTAVRSIVDGLDIGGGRVQEVGGQGIRVQTAQLDPADEDRLVDALAALLGEAPEDASRLSVGPTFGSQVAESALRALIVFLIVVALFMAWRLEWKMAGAALIALAHDLIFTAGIYALVGFEVSPATVIAILTILGYSLYDTVVVFDKIQENVRERGDRHAFGSIVNLSMNQVLMRSINTSLTTLIPISSLLFVGSFLLGATTLREFALALFVGVATGTYSSIFLAAPILGVWKEGEEHWIKVRRRVERKGAEDDFAPTHGATVPAASMVGATGSGAVPRPPRKRRKHRR
ncbi:MAG: protein translocase subunit SecF [Acidimicrobiia bacterium]|nr:MAG: protein translocase subunit SecF [Acidimicrobiia bacterium]